MFKKFKITTGFIISGTLILFPSIIQAATDCHSRQILTNESCIGDEADAEESTLHQLINEYRSQYGLAAIPLSASLSLVANRHVRDLQENVGSLSHGWSDCPYDNNDSDTYACMWKAPQRLGTAYTGNGYENAFQTYQPATAEASLEAWKNSSAHNAVMLNKEMWNSFTWNALGIGIYENYAVLWFGEDIDPVQITSISQPTDLSIERTSNAIFNAIEQDFSALFSPAVTTQVVGDNEEVIYYRLYNNPYQSMLATYQGDFWYAFYGQWKHLGTLDEANQFFCDNQC